MATDIEFVKDIVLEENAEELFSLDVDVSAAIKDGLPWELVEFSADRLITINRKYNYRKLIM